MVEYEIIVFTGTNSTLQLVLFPYSKSTPFNILKSQLGTLEFKFWRSQIETANFICKTCHNVLSQKHLFDIILLIIQEGIC